jgi:lactoylglutathione lyase
VKALSIGKVSEIMYVNISSPYYFFVLDDPDGNTIEITGYYSVDPLD